MSYERLTTRRVCCIGLGIVLASSACEVDRTPPRRGAEASPQAHMSADATAGPTYRTAGDPCTVAADCPPLPGASCLAWPDGYCTVPCDPDGSCEEGFCAEAPGLGLTCLRDCANDRECRAGYGCVWTTDGMACAPGE